MKTMAPPENNSAIDTPAAGWRVSTHVFIAWTLIVAGLCAYDMLGPARYDGAGTETNGTWAGRALLVWLASMLLLAAYRGITSRKAAAHRSTDLDELRKLVQLRDDGALTESEFEARKARILADG